MSVIKWPWMVWVIHPMTLLRSMIYTANTQRKNYVFITFRICRVTPISHTCTHHILRCIVEGDNILLLRCDRSYQRKECISRDVKYRYIIFPKLHAYNYILLWFWYELILYDCMWSTPDEYPWIHRMNHQGLIRESHYYVYKKCNYNGICDTRTRKRSTSQSYCMHMVWHWIHKILTFARRILITNKIT